MKMRKAATCLAILFITAFLFISCQEPEKTNNNDVDVVSMEEPSKVSSKIEKPIPNESEKSTEETEEDNTKKIKLYRVENIVFNYTDDLIVKEIEGLPYFYYNETSFFYAESVVMDSVDEDIDEDFVTMFFEAAKESFSQGSWQNVEITSAPQMIQFNGLNIWIGEISTETEGFALTSNTALLYYDGRLTNLTLITDDNSYQTSLTEFADTIASISPAV